MITSNANETVIFSGKLFEILEWNVQVEGRAQKFERARRAPGVRLIIPNFEKQEILLSREWRAEIQNFDYRLPGGKVFDSNIEYQHFLITRANIVDAAKTKVHQEAAEEVGLDVIESKFFSTSRLGATVEWDLLYFTVEKYRSLAAPSPEPGEIIFPEWVPFSKVTNYVLDGVISEERSALTLLRWLKTVEGSAK